MDKRSWRGKYVRFSLLLTALLLLAIPSFAQSTAKIVGTVRDSSGASVPGAMVKVTDVDTNITRTLTTDASGFYNALELPTGNYQVEVSASGFKSVIRKGITLEVTQAPEINFTLEVGATEQQVTQVFLDAGIPNLAVTGSLSAVLWLQSARAVGAPLDQRLVEGNRETEQMEPRLR